MKEPSALSGNPMTTSEPRATTAVDAVSIDDASLQGLASRLVADDAGTGILDDELARARAAGDRRLLGECLVASGRTHMFVSETASARQRFLECLAVVNGNEALVAEAHVGLGWAALAESDYGAAGTHLNLALALSATSGAQATRAAALVWSGELATRQGDYDAAQRHLRAALKIVAPPKTTAYPATRALLALGRLALDRGELDDGEKLFRQAMALARQAADPYLVAPCLQALGAVALARGERGQATSLLGEAAALAGRHHARAVEAAVLEDLGRLARASGDLATAAVAHGKALSLRSHMGDRAGVADSLEALGRVGVAAGQPGAGIRLLAAADALREQLGHARPRFDADDYETDVSAARAALGSAGFDREWAAGVQVSPEVAVAFAACAGFGHPTTPLDTLTAAECQVVELVAEGFTNREIAEHLGLSPRTVQSHLRHVFAKLGLPTRAALVREVRQRDATGVAPRPEEPLENRLTNGDQLRSVGGTVSPRTR
jgi:DNA-binding CsgD family transcriptional regulator/tetratricopeptide (TPR) repeat protein